MKVWLVVRDDFPENSYVIAAFGSEEEAERAVVLFRESGKNRKTEDGLIKSPFVDSDRYYIDSYDILDSAADYVAEQEAEQMVHVERLRELRKSSEFYRGK